MEQKDKYIRFDWAIKRLLRNKANFGVLEGFLTVLLGEKIQIMEILESEGNQQREDDKFNRVDIKARNSKDEIILVEVQHRPLSKTVHIPTTNSYFGITSNWPAARHRLRTLFRLHWACTQNLPRAVI